MKFDISQLETAPLQFFILHSGVFIAVVATTFFILGLWFGALTWGRYKKHKKALQLENSRLKEEMATLKRRIAEGAVKATPDQPTTSRSVQTPASPAPSPAPARPTQNVTPPTESTASPTVKPSPSAAPVAPGPTAVMPKAEAKTDVSSNTAKPTSTPESSPSSADTDDPLPQLPSTPKSGEAEPPPAVPMVPPPAPIAPKNPIKNVVKAKPRPTNDEIEPVPFLLGPIGDDEEEMNDASPMPEAASEVAPPHKTDKPPKADSATETLDGAPPESVLGTPVRPTVLKQLSQPPPPAAWKTDVQSKRISPGSNGLLSGGAAPMNAVETEPDNGEEKPTRVIEPREDPSLGLLYTERPNDDDIDDLKRIKGISNILEGQLNEFGVYTYKQIAAWSPSHVREFSDRLAFKDRIDREKWVTQAQELTN